MTTHYRFGDFKLLPAERLLFRRGRGLARKAQPRADPLTVAGQLQRAFQRGEREGGCVAALQLHAVRAERLQRGQARRHVAQRQLGARAQPAPDAQVVSGFLEGANVGPITGMNELISASRSFESFQRVIQAFRSLDERAARDLAGG